MSKLKNIISQLNANDFQQIYNNLISGSAEKSAFLLKFLREDKLTDAKIMAELEVNSNAYYTLRSRLNEKIEEYLLRQMESPRTDLLKKVANIQEVLFTKKKAIAIATLKKLEKELLDYDLSNELTVVYKTLRKLYINHPDYYQFSQLYNKHVSYMLALDKAENVVAEYCKRFGNYYFTGDENEKLGLTYLMREINNLADTNPSHRFYTYKACISVFHRLYVEDENSGVHTSEEPIEDMLNKIEKVFETYSTDSIYFHLQLVFDFLRLEYYTHYKVYRKADTFFEDVNTKASLLISNFSIYSFTPKFLNTRIEWALRSGSELSLYEEDKLLFENMEADPADMPNYTMYYCYRAISCYYACKYDEASVWLNDLLNAISFKHYPMVQLYIKILLALQYALVKDFDLFNQLMSSIKRQLRLLGKENFEDINAFLKILKVSLYESGRTREQKIMTLKEKLKIVDDHLYNPLMYVYRDTSFLDRVLD